MDIEKDRRKQLIAALGADFDCFEEVRLRHAFFDTRTLYADVVALPRDSRHAASPLAFEVKEPNAKSRSPFGWLHAFHQASDYVYAAIDPHQRCQELRAMSGLRVRAAFVFPSYERDGTAPSGNVVEFLRGAAQLALHFRVGTTSWEKSGGGLRFRLMLGVNEIWRSDVGFCHSHFDLLSGIRSFGSGKIDVLAEIGKQSD